ncbi:MAG: hypothetical protein H0V76_03870 [Blastocatellia bacterium]|nr:hypothetical protein [Blastocatellia bacterium]
MKIVLRKQMQREGEKGAALIMALLISALVLALSVSLILATSVNSWNFTDATAEQQAYNAAENGIQAVVDVLRYKCTPAISGAGNNGCRVKPNPLYVTTEGGQTIHEHHKLNKITFAKVVGMSTSNSAADESENPRMSRVLSYAGSAATDRVVVLGNPANYNAFDLSISDPDNTGSYISYVTQGKFFDYDLGNNQQITFGSGANFTRVAYQPTVVSNLHIPADTVKPTDFGKFVVTLGSSGGAAVTRLIRFEIAVHMTVPFSAVQVPATRMIRGYIVPPSLINGSRSNDPANPNIIFDSKTYNLRGSDFVLEFGSALSSSYPAWAGSPAPAMYMDPNYPPIGYKAVLTGATGGGFENKLQATMSPPEPTRIRIVSTGYGPRGSRKTLEAIIQNNYFNGLGAPATLTMVGPPWASNGTFTFDPGNSNAMLYSGIDLATGSTDIIPPVGTSHPPTCGFTGCEDPNLDTVIDGFGNKIDNTVIGTPANVSSEVPRWLKSPSLLDATVKSLHQTALNSYDPTNSTGRVFTNTNPTSWGNNATGTGITFCDGDCTLGPIAGGGILVVTGKLTLHGNFDWNGLIIVTGSDGVLRSGGGNGTIRGNIVVAPYLNSTIFGNVDPIEDARFLAPQWKTQGGGNSTIQYNSDNQNSGLGAISNNVLGVVEK